jgi:hypothetical protein
VHTALLNTFTGAWIVPALLLGIGVTLHCRRRADSLRLRVFWVTLIVAALFVWLSLGPKAGLFSLLHQAPVWSRFRDAYKYFERAVPLLVVAGALGLELAASYRPPRLYPLLSFLLCIASVVLWIALPAKEPLIWLAAITVAVTLLGLALVQTIALIASTHSAQRSKSYAHDRRADARLPIADSRMRILPLSEGPPSHPYTRPLGIFFAPMLDGYASVSGHRFALSAARLNRMLQASVAGVPSRRREKLPTLLSSNFLKLADVAYLIVDQADTAADQAVRRAFPDAPVTATTHARIFSLTQRYPRVYFATEQITGNHAGLYHVLYGGAPLYAAAVEGDSRARALPPAQVLSSSWKPDRIDVRVNAPEGGLLVFSTSYSPEWQADIDGGKARVVPVDDSFAGVWVPAAAQSVTLHVRKWPLYAGLGAAALGFLVLFLGRTVLPVQKRHTSTT